MFSLTCNNTACSGIREPNAVAFSSNKYNNDKYVGLRMDDTTLRIAVGLRLGTTICAPHICQCCGVEVSAKGTHGLSCKASSGRHFRHIAMNDIIVRTMSAAGIPARLEPPGLSRSDGKRPDGMSLVPWGQGRPLVWDTTCPDIYLCSIVQKPGNERCWACSCFSRREEGCEILLPLHPGGHGDHGSHRPRVQSFPTGAGEAGAAGIWRGKLHHVYLLQRLSMAVQRGNAVAIMGCARAR